MHNGVCWVYANHPLDHRWAGLPNRDVSHAGSSHTETSAEPESLDYHRDLGGMRASPSEPLDPFGFMYTINAETPHRLHRY
jgi:hypothetical protein